MDSDETFTWHGKDLPVWNFNQWRDLEDFLDRMCPPEYVANITREHQAEHDIWGLVFSREPCIAATAVSAYRITDPEPERP